MYKYLKHIDIVEFILRKIKLMENGGLPIDELKVSFGYQINLLESIYKDDLISLYEYKDSDYDDCFISLKLTKRGNLYLYLIDNREKVDKFFNMLEELGCNQDIFNEFLLSQDLEKNVDKILMVNNFMDFCHERGFNVLAMNYKNTLKRVKKQ